MNNILTCLFGQKLFISIDLSKIQGKTRSGKSLNVATSNGYRPLEIDPKLRLKLHLYELGQKSHYADSLGIGAESDDFNQLLAIVSGLNNSQRQALIRGINQMMVRDSIN